MRVDFEVLSRSRLRIMSRAGEGVFDAQRWQGRGQPGRSSPCPSRQVLRSGSLSQGRRLRRRDRVSILLSRPSRAVGRAWSLPHVHQSQGHPGGCEAGCGSQRRQASTWQSRDLPPDCDLDESGRSADRAVYDQSVGDRRDFCFPHKTRSRCSTDSRSITCIPAWRPIDGSAPCSGFSDPRSKRCC